MRLLFQYLNAQPERHMNGFVELLIHVKKLTEKFVLSAG